MDEFGVLVESIGFKAHGKSSAPLADLKKTPQPNSSISSKPINNNNPPAAFDFDLDVFNTSSSSNFYTNNNVVDDDVFNLGAFKTSSSNNYSSFNDVDDVFGPMNSGGHYDVLGNRVSPVVKTDDLLGNFDNLMKSSSGTKKSSVSEPVDLLADLGVKSSSSLNGRKSEANAAGQTAKSFSVSEDPFVMFERAQGSSYNVNNGASVVDDYLDSLFNPGTRSNTRSSQSSTTEDSVYDALFNNNVVPKQPNKASSVSSNSKKQAPSKAKSTNDYSYLFGMDVAPPSEAFQEIEGESDERRKARFNHHLATRERMNKALNEKNKRDLQAQQEQDEKHRVAATLEGDIKRWAVGKEGNLRALLSSLQHVLWAGSGWQPISLTDLITSTAVKKAYYKATLCVHPDKVQQKGASVQHKYIAEKVFDLLKEAWNKFNAEEFKKH